MPHPEVSQGEEIRQMREAADLTQEQAAERLDMNPRTYGAYEREERDVSYKQMKKTVAKSMWRCWGWSFSQMIPRRS